MITLKKCLGFTWKADMVSTSCTNAVRYCITIAQYFKEPLELDDKESYFVVIVDNIGIVQWVGPLSL